MNEAQKTQLVKTGLSVGVPVIGVASVVFIAMYKLKKAKESKRNDDGTPRHSAPSIADMTVVSSNLTITPDDAALMAQTLYQSMQGFGTKEETVYDIINNKLKTKDDLLLLISKFGLRKNLWGTRAGFIGADINLIAWLNIDLSKRELDKIRPTFERFGIPL